ncbi:hypothetical protein LQ938_10200 [Microbacterium sp. cx-55]|uniref:hypothetical protein n=1 Tax=Microbacterium sp. cx-55 TaxID=2875948 RepID=UPI001CBE2A3D|nr:hypothetical protein [Microbacterium sp. cx-55]MBZ4485868.1 hypothetical protein [Microbacterium sp. cx-55]UGB34255.1 hypothetical protein LQ938_10200 [Microbacterium sp. cx-55]
MWSDRQADAAACPGSGAPAEPAHPLPNGFPHGRALCPECWGFAAVADGVLTLHDAFRGAEDDTAAADRAAWFNVSGWSR